MIVFLTLCYCAVLALLVRLGAIRLTTGWKLSPLLWMSFLFAVLFVPMQWGAPSGSVASYKLIDEVIPNVSGEVVEIPARANVPLKRGDVIFRIDPRPFQYEVTRVEAAIDEAKADQAFAQSQYNRNEQAARTSAVAQAELDSWRAKLAGASARIANLGAQLETARYNLEQTVVRAPSDGSIVMLSLVVGQRVANLPIRSWVAFVTNEHRLLMFVNQHQLRHVRSGQQAEVVLKAFPGHTLPATVDAVVEATAGGQLSPSGVLSQTLLPGQSVPPSAIGVRLDLDPEAVAALPRPIPGGASGTGAIYTDSAGATHLIRRVMLRMAAWMNYVNPY